MAERRPHVLIAGVSTRALAVSAARAGYRVTAVDAFGDADLRERSRGAPVCADGAGALYAGGRGAPRAARVTADAVAYTSNFENHPEAVAALARGRLLLGNPPAVLAQVRNPFAPHARAAATRLRRPGDPRERAAGRARAGTLAAQAAALGRRARYHAVDDRAAGLAPGLPAGADPRRHRIDRLRGGRPARRRARSLAAARGRARLRRAWLPLLRQPARVRAGSRSFPRQAELLAARRRWRRPSTEAFGLGASTGLDFIARDGVPLPIEVNPRYSASMELVERATGSSLFAIHADACEGRLPEPARLAGARARQGDRLSPARTSS